MGKSKRKELEPTAVGSGVNLSDGQVACKLTLLRKLRSRDLLVSHFSKEEHCWSIDSALGDFRVVDNSKVVACEKALEHILSKTDGSHKQGRPKRDRKTYSVRLTPAVHLYTETLMAATDINISTLVSYLICVAHGAYMDSVAANFVEKGAELGATVCKVNCKQDMATSTLEA